MRRREFITASSAARRRGRSRRARSRVSACGASACSCHSPRTIRSGRPASTAFLQGLQQLGWTEGRNVRIDTRWARGRCRPLSQIRGGIGRARAGRHRRYWQRDLGPLLQATRAVPIVFTQTADPVGAGFVDSLARPGGNATGFLAFEYGLSGKWLELLKQIAPGVTRAAVIRDPAITAGIGQFAAIQSVAPSSGWRSTRSTCATPARSSAPSRPSRAPPMAA